jgi:hypothetical protein
MRWAAQSESPRPSRRLHGRGWRAGCGAVERVLPERWDVERQACLLCKGDGKGELSRWFGGTASCMGIGPCRHSSPPVPVFLPSHHATLSSAEGEALPKAASPAQRRCAGSLARGVAGGLRERGGGPGRKRPQPGQIPHRLLTTLQRNCGWHGVKTAWPGSGAAPKY